MANYQIVNDFQDITELIEKNKERLAKEIVKLGQREDKDSFAYREKLNDIYHLYKSEYKGLKGIKEIDPSLAGRIESLKEEVFILVYQLKTMKSL